jgi:putative transcriptional regulator
MWYPIFSIFPLVALLLSATSSYGQVSGQTGSNSLLTGQLLIAEDSMRDPRFAKTVILMIQHDQHGAICLVVNKPVGEGPFAKLMVEFGIQSEGAEGTVRLYYDGPVDRRIGFFIQSLDYLRPGTRTINSVASITTHPKDFFAISQMK